jgi:hypothetical protein
MDAQIWEWVEATPLIDTHEHLIEESARVSGKLHERLLPCNDWAYLFSSYLNDDLANAGLPLEDEKQFLRPDVSAAAQIGLDDWRNSVRDALLSDKHRQWLGLALAGTAAEP